MNNTCLLSSLKRAIAVCLLLGAAGPLFAAFNDSGWGVRPLGMGGAFTAVANDANAQLYNPSGLSQISAEEFTFMSSKLFTGVDGLNLGQNYFGYLRPVGENYGSMGFSWAAFSSPGEYSEDTFAVSYGRNLNDLVRLPVRLDAGLNVKYLSRSINIDVRTYDDPVFKNGATKSAVTGDLGIMATAEDIGLSIGLMSKNVSRPDIGALSSDPVPNENVLGVAYYQEEAPFIKLPYFTAALDLVSRDKNIDCRVGLETWLMEGKFGLRAGARPQEVTFGLGYEISVGNDTKLVLDYALAWPLQIEKTSGTHRIGVTLRLP